MADLVVREHLTADLARHILRAARRAGAHDGVLPLSEQSWLTVTRAVQSPGQRHVLAWDEREHLVGYGVGLPVGVATDAKQCEIFVDPAGRCQGTGTRILAELDAHETISVWAHHDLPIAQAFLLGRGYRAVRRVTILSADLAEAVGRARVLPSPAGYSFTAFDPQSDAPELLAANQRIFAGHPEQGRWTAQDLADRLAQGWFDRDGLQLARSRSGDVVGFGWSKVEAAHRQRGVGEFYVMGVDELHRGRGLGAKLTALGMRYLHRQGLDRVILYADLANDPAIRIYRRLGFVNWCSDVLYRKV